MSKKKPKLRESIDEVEQLRESIDELKERMDAEEEALRSWVERHKANPASASALRELRELGIEPKALLDNLEKDMAAELRRRELEARQQVRKGKR